MKPFFPKVMGVLKKRKGLILLLVLLVSLFILYKSDKVMIDIPKHLAGNIYMKTNLDFFPLWTKITYSVFRLEDEINIFRIKKNLLDGDLPIYNLQLSSNDLEHFDNLSKISTSRGYMDSSLNSWISAKLDVDGKEFRVKVKLHGDSIIQWSDESKSYKIKSEKDEYINKMRQFNLILFEDRLLNGRITRILAKEFGLMDIRDDIAVLKINGVIQGLYYLQESLDYNFLEYNRCSNCEIIKITDNLIEDHPFYSGGGISLSNSHISPFDYEVSNIDLFESELDTRKILNSVNRLFQDINENNVQGLIRHFDIDQLSSFEAMRMIIGDPKLISGDNIRLAYSSVNSKFYPIPINENIAELKLEKGGFEHNFNKYGNDFSRLFYLLSQDDQLRYLRNKKIYQFITKNKIFDEIEKNMDKYLPYALSYKTNNFNTRYINSQSKDVKKIIWHNMNAIKNNFEYSKSYINVVEKDNKITFEVIPDSIAEIKFNDLKVNLSDAYYGKLTFIYNNGKNITSMQSIMLENSTHIIDLNKFVEDLYFSAGLDENLYPKKRTYRLEILFDSADRISIGNIDVSLRNDITGMDISRDDTYVQIADDNDYYDTKDFQFEQFQDEYPQLKWSYNAQSKQLTLLEGEYNLDKDMIIPKLSSFRIEPGVVIFIAEGKSILSYSPVDMLGTKDKLIKIASKSKNAPFGTFAIVGDGTPGQKTRIDWLDFSGGNEKWLNGMFFSGQLAINHMSVFMNNTLIHGSKSDDGINIKYSDVLIDNSKFFDNLADQIDMDYDTAIVKNSEFTGYKQGFGGDNLDFSGSKALVKNNKFLNSLDKGVSVGEETEILLYKNVFSYNNASIAVKDKSQAYIFENTFSKNKIAINSYQKKQLFAGGTSYIYENKFLSNDKDFSTDTSSKIYKLKLADQPYKSIVRDIENDIIDFSKIVKDNEEP